MPLQACDKCGVYVERVNGICPSCHHRAAEQSPRRTTGSSPALLDPFEQGPWSRTASTHEISTILAQKRIRGADGLTCDDIAKELLRGGRFVVYEYCISVIILTLKQPSNVYFLRAGESGIWRGIGFALLSGILGWWGIPWGPIYTIGAIIQNTAGGLDVTEQVLFDLRSCGAEIPLGKQQAGSS